MSSTKNKTRKRGRKVMMIVLIIVAAYVGLTIISTVVNQILSRNELAGIEPTGQMVEVNGSMMHIRSMGDGEQTIVIMPGLGTALPSSSFAPFARERATDFTVVIIDYFGTGFSNQVDTPRTNANFADEIRQALFAGGFEPPFILMPHSASGAYADYFAIRHPDEVTALVLLDTVHTHKHLEPNATELLVQLSRFAQFVGSPRLLNRILMSSLYGYNGENGFTPEEVGKIRLFMNHEVNLTSMNRIRLYNETIHEVVALDFPQDIPVLSIRPTRPNPGSPMNSQENNEAHMARYGAGSQMIILEGNHNIHMGNYVAIREAINEFLDGQM